MISNAGTADEQIGDTVAQVSDYAGFTGRVDVTLSGAAPNTSDLLDSVTTVLNGNNAVPPPAENINSILVALEDGTVLGEFVRDGDSVVNVLG